MTKEGSTTPGWEASQTLRQALTLKKAVSFPMSALTEPIRLLQLTAEPLPSVPSPEWTSGTNIRPEQFLGALCPSVCSFLTGLGLHRACFLQPPSPQVLQPPCSVCCWLSAADKSVKTNAEGHRWEG